MKAKLPCVIMLLLAACLAGVRAQSAKNIFGSSEDVALEARFAFGWADAAVGRDACAETWFGWGSAASFTPAELVAGEEERFGVLASDLSVCEIEIAPGGEGVRRECYDSIESLAADPVVPPLVAKTVPRVPQQASGLLGVMACLLVLLSGHRVLD